MLIERFLCVLEEMVKEKYGPWLREMNLVTRWKISHEEIDDYVIPTRDVSFSINFNTKSHGKNSKHEPLIEFIFAPNAEKLNEDYTKEVFYQMDMRLGDCLKKTYGDWMIAMHKYHWHIFGHFGERIVAESPMDEPEEYFLTHETVILILD